MTEPTQPPSLEPAPPPGEQAPPGPPAAAEAPAGSTIEEVLAAATPHAWVTPALTGLIAVCFGASLLFGVDPISPTAEQLFRVGGSFGPSLADGEWWRLLTSAFLHFGLLHIAFNLWAFWSAGQFAERLFGNAGFLAIYLLSALGGSLLGAAVKPLAVSAGASGAVFGVYGALMAFAWTHRGIFPPDFLARQRTSLLTFLGYNLVYGLMSEHVGLAAHGGGLVVGLAGGWLLRRDLRDPAAGRARRAVAVAAMAVALLLCGVGLRYRLEAQPQIRSATLAERAGAALKAGRAEEAVAHYTAALEADPDWHLRFARSIALAGLDRLQEARRDAAQAAQEAPPLDVRPMSYLGWLQFRLQEFADTERTCTELWRRQPWKRTGFQADELAYCASVALAHGDTPLALERATRLLAVTPDAPETRGARALARWRTGEFDGALEDLDHAIATTPDPEWTLNLRASIRVARGDFAPAKEDADRVLSKSPEHVAALGARCFALAGLGQRDAARRDCARAIELAPPGSPEDRGMLAWLDGDRAAARRLWSEAARKSPGSAKALAPWLEKAGGER